MPWRAPALSEVRLGFVHAVRIAGLPVAEAARRYGISRRTAYKWLSRFDREPAAPLVDRSRRPHRSPSRTPHAVVEKILSLHEKHRWAPRRIHDFLTVEGKPAPSPSTIAFRSPSRTCLTPIIDELMKANGEIAMSASAGALPAVQRGG